MEPIVPIGAQLGAQDTPSVIQGAQDTPSVNQGAGPAISNEQTMQSTQRYGTLPYVSGLPYTASLPYAALPVTVPKRFWRAQEVLKDSKSDFQALTFLLLARLAL